MSSASQRTAIAVFVAVVSVVMSLLIIQPFLDAPVGFDTQATVLYFDRLASGARLEQALTTTPKPFLTVVYGLIHATTGDWRPIVWATILALAAAAGLASVLASRVAGAASAVLVGLAVASTPLLVEDAAYGNAVPWAVLGWVLAGTLLGGDRPRPIAAGIVLALAALCRLETLVIVAVGGAALAWARFGPWPTRWPRPRPPHRAWAAAFIPFAALPVMLVHDYLLTGDPLFWVDVSRRYSDALRERSSIAEPVQRMSWFVRRFLPLWPLLVFAAAGLAVLVRRRAWLILVGLTGMGPGIAAFLVLLAARGTYAPERYALPIDIAVAVLGAFGVGWAVEVGGAAIRRRVANDDGWAAASAVAVAVGAIAIVACLSLLRIGPFDPRMAAGITDTREVNQHLAQAKPTLRLPEGDARNLARVQWLVPTSVRPRTAVDLGVPLTSLGGLSVDLLEPDGGPLAAGQRIFFDRRAAGPDELDVLESGVDIAVGDLALRPLVAEPSAGFWVYGVEPR